MASNLNNLKNLEDTLWNAADNLRANSKLTSSEYCMPVLGIIFLRHASNRYNEACRQIAEDQTAGKMADRAPTKADFIKRRALMLPKEAQYEELLKLPKGSNLGTALVNAMNAIERDFEPLLNQLPKDYEKFNNALLEDLLRNFDSEALRMASGDVYGRIYEYFLMKFAMQGAQDNGEFFTPPSLVQMLINVIEPNRGIVCDPACGSGGMFVQSSHFIEQSGADTSHRLTFYGQEKTATTIRLAKMNLAVHGLEGEIREANTFYDDVHSLYGKCDFVLANPPFNVDGVDAEKVKNDQRLTFGLPGVNKEKKVSNGNYLWISYFHSYLGPKGRAGFVMSSQASSAGHGEAAVRRKLIETGDVDVMISIRSNFFYTRTVPCELWHFDKSKPAERRDQILMIDARNVYRKVTRKIYDFTPEQAQNLTAIVWLYRGQSDRFISLVQNYLDRTLKEAAAIAEKAASYKSAYEALATSVAPFLQSLPRNSSLHGFFKELDNAASACFKELEKWTAKIANDWKTSCEITLSAQKILLEELKLFTNICNRLNKDLDLIFKLSTRLIDTSEKDYEARSQCSWDGRAIGRIEKELDSSRRETIGLLKNTSYFQRQADWLLTRFPEARFVPVPGLCCIVTQSEIKVADWSLTPGRFVGVTPSEVDENFDFEQALSDIQVELADLNQESITLASNIQKNFEGLCI